MERETGKMTVASETVNKLDLNDWAFAPPFHNYRFKMYTSRGMSASYINIPKLSWFLNELVLIVLFQLNNPNK